MVPFLCLSLRWLAMFINVERHVSKGKKSRFFKLFCIHKTTFGCESSTSNDQEGGKFFLLICFYLCFRTITIAKRDSREEWDEITQDSQERWFFGISWNSLTAQKLIFVSQNVRWLSTSRFMVSRRWKAFKLQATTIAIFHLR